MGNRKVKRYKNIYRPSGLRSRAFKTGMTVLAVVVLAVIGWSIYDPVYDFLMNREDPQDSTVSSSEASSAPASSSEPSRAPEEIPSSQEQEAPSSEPASGSSEAESEAESQPEPPAPVLPQGSSGVYMSADILKNPARRQSFLSSLSGKGIDSVLFDLKDPAGMLTYSSQLEDARNSGAVPVQAVDLSQITREIREKGFIPVGRLHAFKDSTASRSLKDSMVKYVGTEWAWLDNSKELGGKPWLNPFSPVAQQYLIDLACEAADQGVEELILDSVHFPVGFALDKASYGTEATPAAKNAVLAQFVRDLTAAVQARGASASVYMPASAVLGTEQERYGGNPVPIAGDSVVLGVMPSLFGNAFNSEELVMESPVLTPYETVQRSLSAALPKFAEGVRVIAMVQGYTATNVDPLCNREYNAEDVKVQLQALQEAGVEGSILYSPTGVYPQP